MEVSIFRITYVECDFCQGNFQSTVINDTAADARAEAREQIGFHRVQHEGQLKDICGDCFDAKAHREAQS